MNLGYGTRLSINLSSIIQNSGLSSPLGSPNRLEGLIMVQSSVVFFIACSERCLACMYFEPFGSGLAPSALIKRNLFTPFCSATAATRSDPLNWSLSFVKFCFGNSLISATKYITASHPSRVSLKAVASSMSPFMVSHFSGCTTFDSDPSLTKRLGV